MADVYEGYMPYLGYKTYYRVVGNPDTCTNPPLLCLHGGPGSTHNYFEVLDVVSDMTQRQVIMYDQIGCGNSYLEGHPELWNQTTWLDELEALREHLHIDTCHLIGQSWGGMMQMAYMCDRKPEGILSLIISSGNPSSSMWAEEGMRRIKLMDQDMQDAIAKAIEAGDFSGKDYVAAEDEYMRRYADYTPRPDLPDCVVRPRKFGLESYMTAWGPSEFYPTGNLKDFEYVERLGEIDAPTLVVSGIQDLCSPWIAKTMTDHIKGARWEFFEASHHTCFVDQTQKYLDMLVPWLNERDPKNA